MKGEGGQLFRAKRCRQRCNYIKLKGEERGLNSIDNYWQKLITIIIKIDRLASQDECDWITNICSWTNKTFSSYLCIPTLQHACEEHQMNPVNYFVCIILKQFGCSSRKLFAFHTEGLLAFFVIGLTVFSLISSYLKWLSFYRFVQRPVLGLYEQSIKIIVLSNNIYLIWCHRKR